jgi:hypothetical protein
VIASLLSDVPVTPDGPTAQRWAVEELSRPEYRERRSLLSRIIERVLGWFDGLGGTGLSGATSAIVVVAALALVVAVAFLVAGPVRRSRRLKSGADGAVRAAGDVRTADQMRAAADAAARSGDFSLALVERFRAVVHGLEERLVIDERVGRTAHEAGTDAGYRLPSVATELAGVAALFDDVAYGGRRATADDDARVRALDERVRHERPTTRADVHTASAR